MTQRPIRHLPVKDGDDVVGIISIGDVLKHRLGEVELEANVLRDYAILDVSVSVRRLLTCSGHRELVVTSINS